MPMLPEKINPSKPIDIIRLIYGGSGEDTPVRGKWFESIRMCLGKKVKMLSIFSSSLVGEFLDCNELEDIAEKN